MAGPKKPRGRAKSKAPAVIDVGDSPKDDTDEADEKDAKDEVDEDKDEAEGGAEEGVDTDLVHAVAIDVDDAHEEPDDSSKVDEENEKRAMRGGSLARRDPMAVYMSETRRYPLLSPE